MANNIKKRNKFFLVDYKGKFDIACDDVNEYDYEVGTITRKQLIEEAGWRKVAANYFGVPAYIGKDKELKKIYG